MKKINETSGMPQMEAAFSGWFTALTVIKVTQSVVNGFVADNETPINFQGTIQPLSPDQIQLKPEGQRSWQWLQIHCLTGTLNLVTNDRISYNGIEYKVMALYDYSLNNFIEYHLVKDFQQ